MKIPNVVRILAGLALGLLAALPVTPVLANTETNTISVYAHNASLGQKVEVQWGDPLGGWHTVEGWRGTLDTITPQGVPFKRFTVFQGNFGQKPFRWAIFYADGVTVWAYGPGFTLPTVPGTDFAETLDVQNPVAPVPAATSPAPTPTLPGPVGPVVPVVPAVPAGGAYPLLNGHTFTFGVGCFSGNCGDSKITALIGGLPKTIWIGVQWLDGYGVWQTVSGWQGFPSSVSSQGVLLQQWDLGPALFGHGPFRWILYDFDGGPVIGVSPNFNMPASSQLNLYMSMAPY